MARIRTIKPEFFEHRGLASCSPHARLLAIGMLTLADSEGRFQWIPMQVHAAVFPWEAEVKLLDASLELERVGWVRRYTVDGREYAEVINFRKHQRLSGKEAQQKSKCPPYNENSQGSDGEASGCFPEKHLDAQGTGEQGNRGTGEEKTAHSARAESAVGSKPEPKSKRYSYRPPDWVPAEPWSAFVDSRRKSRHPLTDRAAALIVTELAKLSAKGHEPGEVLDQSTRNGWRDVFPIRAQRVGSSSLADVCRSAADEFAGGNDDRRH